VADTKALWDNSGMFKSVCFWLIDKIGGAAVGSAVTAVCQGFYGFWVGYPNTAAFVLGLSIAIVLTLITLGLAIWRHRDGKKLGSAAAPEPKTLAKDRAGTLAIHSAQWISVERGTSKPVERFIREQIKEAIVDSVGFQLKKASLGGDIAGAKDTRKRLKLSYSYGDNNPREIIKDEYEWLVLPEPPIEQPTRPSIEEIIKTAPRVFVDYKYDHSQRRDVLFLRNDKDENAYYPYFEDIEARSKHKIAASSAVPVITGGGPVVECPVRIYSGATGAEKPLFNILNEDLTNSVETVRLFYDDKSGRHFYRDFTLKQQMEKVTWEPGPVRLKEE